MADGILWLLVAFWVFGDILTTIFVVVRYFGHVSYRAIYASTADPTKLTSPTISHTATFWFANHQLKISHTLMVRAQTWPKTLSQSDTIIFKKMFYCCFCYCGVIIVMGVMCLFTYILQCGCKGIPAAILPANLSRIVRVKAITAVQTYKW